jgi:hypothetical protein
MGMSLEVRLNDALVIHPPVVGVKHLKLREVSIERRDVFHPSAPECTDFENVAYRTCDLNMREWEIPAAVRCSRVTTRS